MLIGPDWGALYERVSGRASSRTWTNLLWNATMLRRLRVDGETEVWSITKVELAQLIMRNIL